MMGDKGGLITIIREEFAEKPIIGVHCMAHRLHLAIHKSFDSTEYFSKFDKFMNKLYGFYNSNGHKRKAHLRQMAKYLHEKFYEFIN